MCSRHDRPQSFDGRPRVGSYSTGRCYWPRRGTRAGISGRSCRSGIPAVGARAGRPMTPNPFDPHDRRGNAHPHFGDVLEGASGAQ
jgi:hypothetical protein